MLDLLTRSEYGNILERRQFDELNGDAKAEDTSRTVEFIFLSSQSASMASAESAALEVLYTGLG